MKTKLLPRRATQLLLQTFAKWQQDRCLEMGAALSYYALFSLFPIFLVVTSILGFLLGPETDVFNQILKFARDFLPPESFAIVEDTMLQLNQGSVQAGIVGFLLLFLAASSVFGALDRSVDKIWKATKDEVESDSLWSTAISFVGKKLIAFGLVISTAAFLLLSLLSNIVIRIVMQIITKMDRTIAIFELNDLLIARVLQISSSFLVVALAVLLLLRFLPSTPTRWNDLWPSALLTTSLLLGLQQMVSHNVIQIGAQYNSYGVIGGVMILMLWIYFTCQIFFLGCEFSYVYAHLFGSRRHRQLEL
ncbi:MAG: YihY/virulence factor BrkB family protein [Pleurocapsa sp. MO_192.B19]|nr:YihY/virulence factor BrkB family protein [Pleurocapsa sp. MO_192.B19]